MIVSTKLTAVALSATLLAGGTSVTSALHKDVTLTVDGTTSTVSGLAVTVEDVLRSQGITLGARDLVSPAATEPVADGQQIEVRLSKEIDLTVDGVTRTLHTTATTVEDALVDARVADLEDSRVSLSRSAVLPREGLSLSVTTPKEVTLKVAGKKRTVTTTALTVAEALAARGLSLDADDRVKPGVHTPVTEGLTIVVDRVEVSRRTKTEAVAYRTVKKNDAGLWAGESRVISSGQNGKAKRTYQLTRVNGELVKKEIVSEKVLRKPVDQVVRVGTKTTASGAGLNLARAAMWDRIAQCESTGNWSINTGNGYYGGLQFSLATWNGVGGRDFAAYPHQASRAEQITVANRLYARAGLQPWGCRHAA